MRKRLVRSGIVAAAGIAVAVAAVASVPAQPGPPRLLGLRVSNGGTPLAGDTPVLATVSPNGDGFRDRALIRFKLDRAATVEGRLGAQEEARRGAKTGWTPPRRPLPDAPPPARRGAARDPLEAGASDTCPELPRALRPRQPQGRPSRLRLRVAAARAPDERPGGARAGDRRRLPRPQLPGRRRGSRLDRHRRAARAAAALLVREPPAPD